MVNRKRVLMTVLILGVVFVFASRIGAASNWEHNSHITRVEGGEADEPQSIYPPCFRCTIFWIPQTGDPVYPSPRTYAYCYETLTVEFGKCSKCFSTYIGKETIEQHPHDWEPIPTGYQCRDCSLYMN